MIFNFNVVSKNTRSFKNSSKRSYTTLRYCKCCEEVFQPIFRELAEFCCFECEEEYDRDNNGWRYSNYEYKDISDWDVDDHLAAWYDDMMEK